MPLQHLISLLPSQRTTTNPQLAGGPATEAYMDAYQNLATFFKAHL
jgi:hypothetical protein